MIPLGARTKFGCYLAVGLLSLVMHYSCNSPTTETTPPATSDPKANLLKSLKGANVDGFNFAMEEDATQEIASLTNPVVREPIKLGRGDTNLVLRYSTAKDKKNNSSRTFKTEIAKKGTDLRLRVTDIATGELVTDENFPPGEVSPGEPTFNTLNECTDDFLCKHRPALLAEANRTCKAQLSGTVCHLKDGSLVSVHFIFKPTRLVCLLVGNLPDLELIAVDQ